MTILNEIIEVDNLKCQGCATTINKSLSKIEGVMEVTVDVDTATIGISHDGKTDRGGLLERLGKLGYPEKGTSGTIQKVTSYISCAVGRVG